MREEVLRPCLALSTRQSVCNRRGVDQRASLGQLGEDLACEELRRRGYTILDRRFRTRCGELDIIARDGAVLVFVEVRARSSGHFGHPFESITWQKRHRLSRMAAAYMCQRRLP